MNKKDPMGRAALAYLEGNQKEQILIRSNIAEDDYIPVSYLFRDYNHMPRLEQMALNACKGKILDVGAGVGSHALYLQNKGLDVTCLDNSILNCEVARKRGVNKIINEDFYRLNGEDKYDTLLFMMNGIGIAGTLNNLPAFFHQVKKLLKPDGQILLDSSDLRYLYLDEDSYLIPLNGQYYGEVVYTMEYKNEKSASFNWLFIDPALLDEKAEQNGLKFEKIADGEHYDYLARLTF